MTSKCLLSKHDIGMKVNQKVTARPTPDRVSKYNATTHSNPEYTTASQHRKFETCFEAMTLVRKQTLNYQHGVGQ